MSNIKLVVGETEIELTSEEMYTIRRSLLHYFDKYKDEMKEYSSSSHNLNCMERLTDCFNTYKKIASNLPINSETNDDELYFNFYLDEYTEKLKSAYYALRWFMQEEKLAKLSKLTDIECVTLESCELLKKTGVETETDSCDTFSDMNFKI